MTPDQIAPLRRETRGLTPDLKALHIARSGLLPAPVVNEDGSIDVPSATTPNAWHRVTEYGGCDCNAEFGGGPCWHASALAAWNIVKAHRLRMVQPVPDDETPQSYFIPRKSQIFREEQPA